MWIVIATLDKGMPGIIEFFAENEENNAKDFYTKIRVDFLGKAFTDEPVIGDKASEGTNTCKVSLLHTVDIDEDLYAMIKEQQKRYDTTPASWRAFNTGTSSSVEDNTGVDNTVAEKMNLYELTGDPSAIYTSYRFNEVIPRKELSSIGFDKKLIEYAYKTKRFEGGYGKGSNPAIPEIATNDDDTAYIMIERDRMRKAGFPSINGEYQEQPYKIIAEITKKSWEKKKNE